MLETEVQKRTAELVLANKKLAEESEKRIKVEAQVLLVGEMERKRFSMDLHDDICQRLAGISMLCSGLAAENKKLSELSGLIDETLRRTRQYAHESFPVELNSLGLEKSIGTLCDAVQRQTYGKAKVSYSWKVLNKPEPLENEAQIEINIFRIVQEALNNSLRHAKATKIDVGISDEKGYFEVAIKDNGTGNPGICYPSRGNAGVKQGIGLHSMHYRADQIGADFRIASSRESGTSVVLRMGP